MKSLVIGMVLMFLALNAIGTINTMHFNDFEKKVISFEKKFDITIKKDNGFYMINAKNCSNIIAPNKPVMPVYIKTYLFPPKTKISFKAKIKDIENLGKINVIPSYNVAIPSIRKEKIKLTLYEKNIVYPNNWYKYELHGGIINGKHYTILKIFLYPAIYINGIIIAVKDFEVKIEYKPPEKNIFNGVYDLLIITPSKFMDSAKELANHKESHGIKTIIESMDEIKSMNGRDDAEKVKYAIKDAIEQYGIKYVLLFGGRKPGIKEDWFVPVRYVHTFCFDESKYISDLYYADIYDGNYHFSSWDSNGNGIYGEWPKGGGIIDEMDLYPDVYVGRLACRNEIEAKLMVSKIIEYENGKVQKKVVGVGGDNFEDSTDYYEGEVVTNKTIHYLKGFDSAKVWASQQDVTPTAIKNAIGEGAMFVHFHGHGSPIYWSTHKPNDFNHWQKGLSIFDAPSFFNKGLPIMVFGGCHTAMFNVSLTIHSWTGGIPAPEGLSWWFARKYGGGAIASLGYACFPVAYVGNEGDLDGDGIDEPDCVEGGYGYMELGLFEGYSYGMENLGDIWGYAENRYISTFDVLAATWELHTVEGFTLLGDPSLHIGGYGE